MSLLIVGIIQKMTFDDAQSLIYQLQNISENITQAAMQMERAADRMISAAHEMYNAALTFPRK